jgi:Ca2+-binding EF-hand superfamily protein
MRVARMSALLKKEAGTADDLDITSEDGAIGAITKLYNYINSAKLSPTEMMSRVDEDGDGGLDANEIAAALHNAGVGIPLEELKAMTARLDLDGNSAAGASGLLGIFSKIEQVGSVGSAMAERSLATICNFLNRSRTTAEAVLQELDDGDGLLDGAELAAAMSHFGVTLSANAVANVMVALDLDTAKSVPLDQLARTIDAFYRERRSFASATLDAVLRALEEKQLTGPGVPGAVKNP